VSKQIHDGVRERTPMDARDELEVTTAATDRPAGGEVGHISITGVSKVFSKRDGEPVVALQDVDLEVTGGQFVSMLGPSGCGKTTLLKIVGGLVNPSHGSVTVDGVKVEDALEQRKFGFAFQDATLLPWRTVRANATLLLDVTGQRARRDRVEQLLEMVGLKGFEEAYPAQLSGGMQQRVALARALALDPTILLMDEPFAALDALTRDRMGMELVRIWEEGRKTVVFVTHSISEAVLLSDRVVVLSARPGRVHADVVIDLPRPRTMEVRNTAEFGEYERFLREQIQEM
jgi:NitT/TauT family transport system ATP-binding protein